MKRFIHKFCGLLLYFVDNLLYFNWLIRTNRKIRLSQEYNSTTFKCTVDYILSVVMVKDLKYIILGIVLAFIITLVITKVFMGGLYSIFASFLIAGIIVGYLTGGGTENPAINGMVVGFVGGIIFILFVSIMTSLTNTPHLGTSMFIMSIGGTLTFGIVAGVIFGILSAIGSIIGGYVKSKT